MCVSADAAADGRIEELFSPYNLHVDQPEAVFLKIIPIGILTYAAMKTSF